MKFNLFSSRLKKKKKKGRKKDHEAVTTEFKSTNGANNLNVIGKVHMSLLARLSMEELLRSKLFASNSLSEM